MVLPGSKIWDRLSDNALIANIAQSRAWLEPALSETALSENISLTTVMNGDLTAIAALEELRIPGPFRFRILTSWDNGFFFNGTPLLDQADPKTAMLGLLENAAIEHNAKAVIFRKTTHNKELVSVLENLSNGPIAGYHILNEHQRAALHCTINGKNWFNQNFSAKRRKSYRRLRNRLAETGNLISQTWNSSEAIGPWVDEFLQLEKAGWKGKAGTAIACSNRASAHLHASLDQLAKTARLHFWKITLDDRPVAMLFGFGDKYKAWLGKMAYDETLAQFSPGVLVILDASFDLLDNHAGVLVDSSADPNHPMIDNIWRDRIKIADYMVATTQTTPQQFALLVKLERARSSLRTTAKSVRDKLLNR